MFFYVSANWKKELAEIIINDLDLLLISRIHYQQLLAKNEQISAKNEQIQFDNKQITKFILILSVILFIFCCYLRYLTNSSEQNPTETRLIQLIEELKDATR